VNVVTASFNTIMGQMTEMSQRRKKTGYRWHVTGNYGFKNLVHKRNSCKRRASQQIQRLTQRHQRADEQPACLGSLYWQSTVLPNWPEYFFRY